MSFADVSGCDALAAIGLLGACGTTYRWRCLPSPMTSALTRRSCTVLYQPGLRKIWWVTSSLWHSRYYEGAIFSLILLGDLSWARPPPEPSLVLRLLTSGDTELGGYGNCIEVRVPLWRSYRIPLRKSGMKKARGGGGRTRANMSSSLSAGEAGVSAGEAGVGEGEAEPAEFEVESATSETHIGVAPDGPLSGIVKLLGIILSPANSRSLPDAIATAPPVRRPAVSP